jgi:hypothetical protein
MQVAVDADHSAICKFDSADSGACRLVLNTIAAQIGQALELAQTGELSIPANSFNLLIFLPPRDRLCSLPQHRS